MVESSTFHSLEPIPSAATWPLSGGDINDNRSKDMTEANTRPRAPGGTAALAGRQVARIGFGAMQLPGPGVWGPPRDRDTALAVLRRAVELGVNHIDTAQNYGPGVANELIRAALHPYPEDLVLASKVGVERDHSGAARRGQDRRHRDQ
jgi:pyridoxine 4-dehydrogenase